MDLNKETLIASQKVYEIEACLMQNTTSTFSDFPQLPNKTIVAAQHTLSGMTAVAYQDNQTEIIIIAYCGTSTGADRKADIITDISIAVGIMATQITDAIVFYKTVKQDNPACEIILTGHSLGGGLANEVNVFADGENQSITYNPAPLSLSSRVKARSIQVEKFKNYNTMKDPLTRAGQRMGLIVGETYPNGLETIARGGHDLSNFFKSTCQLSQEQDQCDEGE